MTHEAKSFLAVNVTLKPSHEVLVFAHRQVVITGGRLMTKTANGLEFTGTKLVRGKSPIAVTIDKKPKTFKKLVAYLEYRGLPPLFVRSEPRTPARVRALDTPSAFAAASAGGDPGAPSPAGAPGALGEPALDARRLTLVHDSLTGQERIFGLQFARFDQTTDPTSARPQSEPFTVREILMNRVIRRGAWSRAGKPFPMPLAPTLRAPLRNAPKETHACFRLGLDAFEAPTGKGFDIDHFHRAFAAFTCGELALKLSPKDKELRFCGVPDSAYFFCFAEAALWFHELGIEPSFWAKLLPLFVGAAEAFKDLYLQSNKRKTRFAYARGTPSQRLASSKLLATIDRQYARMSVDELAAKLGSLAAQAFSDEVSHLVVDSGLSPSILRRLTYELLHRRPGAPGDTPWFAKAKTPPQKALLKAIAANDRDKLVRYHDEPELQDNELLGHIAERMKNLLFTDASNGSPRTLRLEICDETVSHYNPRTGKCDPLGFGSSFRYRLARNTKTPCMKGAKPNTELELIIATKPPLPTL